jgi:phage tail sheath protein FI
VTKGRTDVRRAGGAETHPRAPSGWKYVNVRRSFVFIEHFIEEGAHWAVFERNRPSTPTNFGTAR